MLSLSLREKPNKTIGGEKTDIFTMIERLSMQTSPTYGAVIKYGDRVFHTDPP